MFFDLKIALSSLPVCQKRTGKHKQFVFQTVLNGLGGPTVIKGPYNAERVNLIVNRSNKLKEWNVPFIVHPNQVISGTGLNGEPAYYIEYPNLAEGYPISCTPYVENMVNSRGERYTYNLLNRTGLVKLSDAFENANWIKDLAGWLVVSMVALYALEVGDVHFANMLVDLNKNKLYIIDYDDTSPSSKSGEWFYFKMQPRKEILSKWEQMVRPLYPSIIQVLQNLTQDTAYGNKFKDAIKLLENPATGSMEYHGMFGGTVTYSGYTLDVVKSALQKYIRRNITEKAIYAAFEMYRMVEVAGGVAARTNLYNRLAIIAAEDISIANIPLVSTVLSFRKNYDPNLLVGIVTALSESNKSRLASHVYSSLVNPQTINTAQSLGIQVNDVPNPGDLERSQINWHPNDPVEIRGYAEIFLKRLEAQSFSCFIWLRYYILASENKKIQSRAILPRRRQTNPMMIIFECTRKFLHPTTWTNLVEAYIEIKENRPFYMLAVLAALYRIDQLPSTLIPGDASKYLAGNKIIIDEPWVYDKHTLVGFSAGMGVSEFRKEGSLVIPEDPKYIIPEFKNAYMA